MNLYRAIKLNESDNAVNADGTKHWDAFSVTNDGINEENHDTYFVYSTKHGLGPGTVPSDIELSHIYDVPNTMTTIFCSNRELTPEELNKYDLKIFPNESDPELLKALFMDRR